LGRAPLDWIASSEQLAGAYQLAVEAHGDQRRPSDRRLFIEHVTEVAATLHGISLDTELVAVGLLHDSVERGSIGEEELRNRAGDRIASQVMTLSEDPAISKFETRKEALRDQVASAGPRAIVVFAADKLSDIRGLRRGIDAFGSKLVEARIGTSIATMVTHYLESVRLVAAGQPLCAFLPDLRLELASLTEAERAATQQGL
jgi:(p)ppGpp synthase/HD superfamily hydrolase